MSLTNYMGEMKRPQRRPAGFAMSLVAHGAAFFILTQAPEVNAPVAAPNEYKQLIEGHEQKLVWYRFNKELPDVTPRSAKTNPKPLKALNRARQEIAATPAKAPERTQFVWTPAPEIKELRPLDSPNLLAVRLPDPTPPKPELKPFVTPPDVLRPTAQIETPPDVPQLEARALTPGSLPAPRKLVKQFVEPARVPVRKEPVKIEPAPDAPLLEARALRDDAIPKPNKLLKQFVTPPRKVPVKIAEVAPAPEAPPLAANVAPPDAAALDYKIKAPLRPFTAPQAKATASAASAKPLLADAPPAVAAGAPPPAPDVLMANARDLNLVVVGLHPTDQAAALPTAASPAKFSAAPEIRRQGAETAGDGKGISVPDLFVRGSTAARPDVIAQAYAAPTSAENLRAAQRTVPDTRLARAAIPGAAGDLPLLNHSQAALKVSGVPDPRFNGRDTYMMAIQMPNLTSNWGSWLMWYAERTAKETGLAPVAPPIAHRKVDPKYIASAQSDKIEGKVQLLCIIDREGHVSAVQLVRGLDPRLNQSAAEALAKWEFEPAARNGVPVEVDVLVEIPFHLAPSKAVTY